MKHKKNPEKPIPPQESGIIKDPKVQTELAIAKQVQWIRKLIDAAKTIFENTPKIALIAGSIAIAIEIITLEVLKNNEDRNSEDTMTRAIQITVEVAVMFVLGYAMAKHREAQKENEKNNLDEKVSDHIEDTLRKEALKKQLETGTVLIETMGYDNEGKKESFLGAGCIIDACTLLTAEHLMANDGSITIGRIRKITGIETSGVAARRERQLWTPNKTEKPCIVRHPHRDIVLILFPEPIFKGCGALTMTASKPRPNTPHLTMGHPANTKFQITPLLYKITKKEVEDIPYEKKGGDGGEIVEESYCMEGRSYGGNSGGPVINEFGELVGILTRGTDFMEQTVSVTPVVPAEIAALKRAAREEMARAKQPKTL